MIGRARREGDHAFRFFGNLYPLVPAAVSLGELGLASNPILPSLTVMAKAIVEPPALKKSGSRKVIAVLEERERPLRLIHSSKQYRALQVDVGALLSRDLLGDIELPFGRREVPQALIHFREIDRRFERGRIGIDCGPQNRPGIV